ncbi:MAG TPA: sugar-transfer associated ATP-grasp domain-containing protein [Microbacterium sp.]|nr:sugar-transfer associated ATP-grasp domain-containing protein [Microbacterium sp.]
MKRLRYYLSRLAGLDVRNYWRVAGVVAKEARRPRLWILLDMAWSSVVYQAGYLDYQEFEFFLLNRAQRRTWITGGKANAIVVRFNQREHRPVFIDKLRFNARFDRWLGREWLDVRDTDADGLRSFATRHGAVMVKVTDSLSGHGIEKVVATDVVDWSALRDRLLERRQWLVEAFLVQHPDMAALAPASVNTLRMITFFDGRRVHVLEGVLKMGNGADVDNYGQGGMYTLLDEQGVARYPAFDKHSAIYAEHPLTGTPIVGFRVPLYDRVVAMLEQVGREVPQIPYVGWDVAIGVDGPVLIEGNYNTGVFQMKPSLTGERIGLLPRFREVIPGV